MNIGVTQNSCPSELELDRYHYGELRASQDRQLTEHIERCSACDARLRLRERGFAAFDSVNPDRIFARVEARLQEEPKPSLFARIPRVLVPLAAAASVALFFASRGPPEDEVRIKGAIGLSVFRERGGSVEELGGQAGEFRRGDRVRFKVRLPERSSHSQILIVGVEESGKLFTYYPTDGGDRSAEPQVRPDGALAGAIELDAYQGNEWLHLIHCPRRFSVGDLERRAPEELGVPEACERASFLMKRIE